MGLNLDFLLKHNDYVNSTSLRDYYYFTFNRLFPGVLPDDEDDFDGFDLVMIKKTLNMYKCNYLIFEKKGEDYEYHYYRACPEHFYVYGFILADGHVNILRFIDSFNPSLVNFYFSKNDTGHVTDGYNAVKI